MAPKGKTSAARRLESGTGGVGFRAPEADVVRTSVTSWLNLWLWTMVVVGALVALRCR
jgi:hypothetical protein